MKIPVVLAYILFLRAGLAYNTTELAHRELGGLLGGIYPTQIPQPALTSAPAENQRILNSAVDELTKSSMHAKPSLDPYATSEIKSHSVIGALPVLATYDRSSSTATSASTTQVPIQSARVQPDSISKNTSNATESSATAHWKLVGVSVIVVSTIATLILSIVFFDQWTRFLKDVVLGKKISGGSEDLLPDWEKRRWEHKLSDEESLRYPSSGSADSIWQLKQHDMVAERENFRSPFPRRPQPAVASPSFPSASAATPDQQSSIGIDVGDESCNRSSFA